MTGLSIFSPSPEHPPSSYQIWKRAAKVMIADLPISGATIVVFTEDIGKLLKEGIIELRGAAVAQRCKMVSIHRRDQLHKIMGIRGPVLIDMSIIQHAKADIFDHVMTSAASANVMLPIKKELINEPS